MILRLFIQAAFLFNTSRSFLCDIIHYVFKTGFIKIPIINIHYGLHMKEETP